MEELIDVVLKNPFLLLLIIGVLFSYLKGKGKGQQQEEEKVNEPNPVSNPRERQNKTERPQRRPNPIRELFETVSVEEQHSKQIQRLQEQLNTNEPRELTDNIQQLNEQSNVDVSHLGTSIKQSEFKRRIKSNLKNEGLLNSIVMAEVLGAPRSRDPYRNIIARRKNR